MYIRTHFNYFFMHCSTVSDRDDECQRKDSSPKECQRTDSSPKEVLLMDTETVTANNEPAPTTSGILFLSSNVFTYAPVFFMLLGGQLVQWLWGGGHGIVLSAHCTFHCNLHNVLHTPAMLYHGKFHYKHCRFCNYRFIAPCATAERMECRQSASTILTHMLTFVYILILATKYET
jgi:hypothetical protein